MAPTPSNHHIVTHAPVAYIVVPVVDRASHLGQKEAFLNPQWHPCYPQHPMIPHGTYWCRVHGTHWCRVVAEQSKQSPQKEGVWLSSHMRNELTMHNWLRQTLCAQWYNVLWMAKISIQVHYTQSKIETNTNTEYRVQNPGSANLAYDLINLCRCSFKYKCKQITNKMMQLMVAFVTHISCVQFHALKDKSLTPIS